MPKYSKRMMKCAVCGYESEQTVLDSRNTYGSPDLDLRPQGMQRATMFLWIHECPNCGYVCHDLSSGTGIDRELVDSPEYKNCGGIAFMSDLSAMFYKAYYLQLKQDNPILAFHSILHCAWTCDDVKDTENSVRCRERAIALSDKILATKVIMGNELDSHLIMRADILRRCCRFNALIHDYADVQFKNDFLNKVLLFQVQKAQQGDTGCYNMKDVEAAFEEIE